jgi:hypothetical protein
VTDFSGLAAHAPGAAKAFEDAMSIHSLFSRAQHSMPVISWQGQLDAAASAPEVVSVARDYLATFSPYELAGLPEICRPPAKLYDGEDITTYAFDLVRHDFEKEPPTVADLVHRLANFFSHASIRLSEIQAHPRGEEDSRRSA